MHILTVPIKSLYKITSFGDFKEIQGICAFN